MRSECQGFWGGSVKVSVASQLEMRLTRSELWLLVHSSIAKGISHFSKMWKAAWYSSKMVCGRSSNTIYPSLTLQRFCIDEKLRTHKKVFNTCGKTQPGFIDTSSFPSLALCLQWSSSQEPARSKLISTSCEPRVGNNLHANHALCLHYPTKKGQTAARAI